MYLCSDSCHLCIGKFVSMYLIRDILCTAHLVIFLEFYSSVCIDCPVMSQHLSTYEVIYFVLVMQDGDISIKLFKVICEG